MILAPDDTSSKALVLASGAVIRAPEADPPPSYSALVNTPSTSQVDTRPSALSSIIQVPPDLKPSNFIILSRANQSVKGSWLIDPAMVIPQSFLPPLRAGETEATRKNLFLETKNGSVDAEVFVVSPHSGDMKERGPVLIQASSRNGSVSCRIHEVAPNTTSSRQSYQITAWSTNGTVSIQLPRSFRGPMRLKTQNGSVKLSAQVQANSTQFSDLGGLRRSFLGHFNPADFTPGEEWQGDELSVESVNGGVKLAYDDESPADCSKSGGPGFFGRFFGL